MRSESQAPRNSRELAVRNQFFTPRYVVQFLTDNTLGRIWYEMRQGETRLRDLEYLVRRPNEIFLSDGDEAPGDAGTLDEKLTQEELLRRPIYVAFRAKKDPRDIRVLDPACGSGHFLPLRLRPAAHDLRGGVGRRGVDRLRGHGSQAARRLPTARRSCLQLSPVSSFGTTSTASTLMRDAFRSRRSRCGCVRSEAIRTLALPGTIDRPSRRRTSWSLSPCLGTRSCGANS